MNQYKGKCCCSEVRITIHLPQNLEDYSPRKCDCDFCLQHNLQYLSDPNGELHIETQNPFTIVKQGSEQASFLVCSNCGDFIAPIYQFKESLKGAANANCLSEKEKLKEPTIVSPQKLAANEKPIRWDKLWLKVVIKMR